jgi:hypothetical protein
MNQFKNETLPYLNLSLVNLPHEEWRDCIGYDGYYSVSNYGRIRSEERYCTKGYIIKTKILKQTIGSCGEPTLKFANEYGKKTKRVLALVGEAFLGEKKEGYQYCRKNKNKKDNRLENIIITTVSESRKIAYDKGVNIDWGIGTYSRNSRIKRSEIFDIFDNGILVRKICRVCFKELDVKSFYFRNDRNQYRTECKICISNKNNKL